MLGFWIATINNELRSIPKKVVITNIAKIEVPKKANRKAKMGKINVIMMKGKGTKAKATNSIKTAITMSKISSINFSPSKIVRIFCFVRDIPKGKIVNIPKKSTENHL